MAAVKADAQCIQTAQQSSQNQRSRIKHVNIIAGDSAHNRKRTEHKLREIMIGKTHHGKADVLRRESQRKGIGIPDIPHHILRQHDLSRSGRVRIFYADHQRKQNGQDTPKSDP